jgi:glycosyltransferase involved in cell wall biosynthesis
MAAGIPAVIMNAGAATEQIADGFSGYVVGPHDEKTLAERLEAVLRSKESRRMMGVAARQRWKAFFNLELTAAEHCELYRNLLERTPC